MNWVNQWDGNMIKSSELKNICKVNDEQFKTLKKNRVIKDKLATFTIPKKGYYCK